MTQYTTKADLLGKILCTAPKGERHLIKDHENPKEVAMIPIPDDRLIASIDYSSGYPVHIILNQLQKGSWTIERMAPPNEINYDIF